ANNRSTAGMEAGFQVSRRLSTRVLSSWQWTHGGLRMPDEVVVNQDRILQHDRLLRDNYWHLGAGASYSFSHVDVFGSYTGFARGTNSHAGRTFSAGVSMPFEITP